MAYVHSTKHTRRSSAPTSEEHAIALRAVEAPGRVTKADRESAAVVLGAREPDEGRYSTLVRQNYLHGKQAPKTGEANVAVPSVKEMEQERAQRRTQMNTKNFPFGFEHVALPIVSEAQGAQQSAVDLRRRELAAMSRPSASPTPYTAAATGGRSTPSAGGGHHGAGAASSVAPSPAPQSEIKAHMDRMRSSNVFDPQYNRSTPTSTQRGSYASWVPDAVSEQREDAARLRRVQTQSSWTPGHEPSKDWRSVKESTMTGAAAPPAQLSTQNLTTCVNIGSPAVSTAETLKSLKQVDFVPHRATPVQPPAFTAHEDHLVLGYRPKDINSTSRLSYTPTQFVPRRAAQSMLPS